MLIIAFAFGGLLIKLVPGLSNLSFTDQVLAGFVIVNSISSWFSIFLPITALFLFVLLAVSLAYLMLKRNTGKVRLAADWYKHLSFIPVILLVVIFASDAPWNYDSGLYHIQAISWIETFPAVPGLGNLHGRLAFDPNIFTMMATFSARSLFGQHIFPVNAFLLIIFAYYLYFIWENRNDRNFGVLFVQSLIGSLAFVYALYNVSSPSPDITVMILSVYLFLHVFDQVSRQHDATGYVSMQMMTMPILIAVYIVTVKLSNGLILMLPFLLLFKSKLKPSFTDFVKLSALIVFVTLPWLIRNYILSGYLIYPFPETGLFDPDWKVLPQQILAERQWIISWARLPALDVDYVLSLKLTEWLPMWFKRMHWVYLSLIVPALLSPLAAIWAVTKTRQKSRGSALTFFIVWPLACIATWVWLIWLPDPRFGYAFIVVSLGAWAVLLLDVFGGVMARVKPLLERSWQSMLMVFCIGVFTLYSFIFWERLSIRRLLFPLDVKYVTRSMVDKQIEYSEQYVHGLKVLVPMNDDRCNAQPLPCTPAISENLLMRGTTLRQGFRMDLSSKHPNNANRE